MNTFSHHTEDPGSLPSSLFLRRFKIVFPKGLLKLSYYSLAEAGLFAWKNESVGKMIHFMLTEVPEKGYKLSSEYFTILHLGLC